MEDTASDKPKRVRKTAAVDQAASSEAAVKPKAAGRAKAVRNSAQADTVTAAEAAKPAPRSRAKSSAADGSATDKATKPRTRKAADAAKADKSKAETADQDAVSTDTGDMKQAAGGAAKKPKAKTSKAAAAPVEKPAAKSRVRKSASSADQEPNTVSVANAGNAAVSVGSSSDETSDTASPANATEALAPVETKATSTAGTPAEASSPAEAMSETASVESTSDAGDAAISASPADAPKSASAEKPWLASYPSNVPSVIPGLPADSLGDLMVNACKRYAGRIAFSCMGRDMKFAELQEASAAFGAYLQSKGLRKGARIALMMPNVLQYPIALMGALRAGYTVVNVNPLYTARELEHQLKDASVEAIVILENFAHTLQSVINNTSIKHVVVASLGDLMGLKGIAVNLVVRRVKKMVPKWTLRNHVGFNAALKAGRSAKLNPVAVAPQDLAFLQYTGGTTGVSKGAMLSHANVLSNIAQNAAWLESAYNKRARPERPVYVCALPLYHIYALTVNALMGMQQGAHNVLIPNPRDIPAFAKVLKRTKFNIFPGLNTLFNALLNNKDFQKLNFSSLVLTFGGGMAVQPAVAERWQALTGSTIAEGYGLSETSPVATANRFDADTFSGTIGLPLPSTEVSIRDENGVEVALGDVGEICIRGPQVMSGYWNQPEETAKVMTADGFLKSGDIGFMNKEGYTKIVDRKKDMILVSGFNVYPNEIEEVVARHPKVLEVAVIGVSDEKAGEVPKLFVVKKDDSLTEEELREFCRENLTGYKRPRHVEFRADLPKTAVGKILRRDLRN
ncbi:long-chain-fatty-acid--CoA ligase [Tianweitania sp. BSSL-BM11]|uniref:Long-chain-fatty-acid--CoA ligase n=2 Tax=Tianweitania aestuarii TaxID=2814886 RepID=A0ABS5RY39_9HYPH|nr:long-chain-fatty-acid--CoA ligase [Tianweitania aestuarii]